MKRKMLIRALVLIMLTASAIIFPSALVNAQRQAVPYELLWHEPNGMSVTNSAGIADTPQITADDHGGTIVLWRSSNYLGDPNPKIFTQRISRNGALLWGQNGKIIFEKNTCVGPKIISDGYGGTIVACVSHKNDRSKIFIQRLNTNGERMWGDVYIQNLNFHISYLNLIPDGNLGTIIIWEEKAEGETVGRSSRTYAQKVDMYGNLKYTTPRPIYCLNTYSYNIRSVSDNNRGAIVMWAINAGTSGVSALYSQRINNNGNPLWGINGKFICFRHSWGAGGYSQLTSDKNGGAIIVFCDRRKDRERVCIIHINKNGYPINTAETDGTPICNPDALDLDVEQRDPKIISDNSNGAIVVWENYYSTSNSDISVQRIDSDGNILWGDTGIKIKDIFDGSYYRAYPELVTDSGNGAFLTWHEQDSHDLYFQQIDSEGNPKLDTYGVPIREEDGQISIDIAMCNDKENGIIAWTDYRNTGTVIYAQKVRVNHPPKAYSKLVFVNMNNQLQITLTGSDPDNDLITLEVVTNPLHGNLSGVAPNLTYTPAANYYGNDYFTFRTYDGVDYSDDIATVNIVVKSPPVLSPITDKVAIANQPFSFVVSATDPDSPTLNFSLENAPSGASISRTGPKTAIFLWCPNLSQIGEYKITFKVTDEGELCDGQKVKFQVMRKGIPIR